MVLRSMKKNIFKRCQKIRCWCYCTSAATNGLPMDYRLSKQYILCIENIHFSYYRSLISNLWLRLVIHIAYSLLRLSNARLMKVMHGCCILWHPLKENLTKIKSFFCAFFLFTMSLIHISFLTRDVLQWDMVTSGFN